MSEKSPRDRELQHLTDVFFFDNVGSINHDLNDTTFYLFPETVVLVALTHGGYDIHKKDGNAEVERFDFREATTTNNCKLTTITASPPGVTFYHDDDMESKYIETIQSVLEKNPQFNYDDAQIDAVTKLISKQLKNVEQSRLKTYEKTVRRNKKRGTDTAEEINEMSEFAIYQNDKMYWIKKHNKNITNFIPNKEFVIKNNETHNDYDGKITILNMEGTPNLLDKSVFGELNVRIEQETTRLFMSDLVKFLYDNGVINIILVDFSCSTIGYEHDGLTERDIRSIRHSIECALGKRKTNKRVKSIQKINPQKSFFTKRRRHKTRQNKNR
jgi:hypothetical protein